MSSGEPLRSRDAAVRERLGIDGEVGGSWLRSAHQRERAGRILAYLWLAVLALATTGGYVREPVTGQHLLKVLIALSVLVAGAGWLFVWRHESRTPLKGLWCLGIWLAVAVAGLIWAPDKHIAVTYVVYMIVQVTLIVLTAYCIISRHDGWFTAAIGYLGMLVVAVNVGIAVWEHFLRSHFHLSGTLVMASHQQGWPSGFMAHPNDLCFLLALYLPFITVWPRRHRTAAKEALAISAIVAVIWVATVAQSRTMVVLLLGQLLWLVTRGMRNKMMASAGALIVLVLLIPFLHDQWPYYVIEPAAAGPVAPGESPAQGVTSEVRRARTPLEVVQAVGTEFSFGGRSGSERLQLLNIGGRLLWESKGLGVGPGNSALLIRQVKGEGRTDLHNWWMELLVDYGLAGFLAFTCFYFWLLGSIIHRWRRLPEGQERYLAEVAMISLVTFALGSIVPSSIAPHTYPWMLFGLALALVSAPGSKAFQVYRREREAPR